VGDDTLTVRNASDDSLLTELGSVQLNRDYASSADFTGSQMTLSGNSITIVLGTPSGTIHRDPSAKELVWTTPRGTHRVRTPGLGLLMRDSPQARASQGR
jgi:hypothetical protein